MGWVGKSGREWLCHAQFTPPVISNGFAVNALHICNILTDMANSQQKETARILNIILGGAHDVGTNVCVTYDYTVDKPWSKRGFTGPYDVHHNSCSNILGQ